MEVLFVAFGEKVSTVKVEIISFLLSAVWMHSNNFLIYFLFRQFKILTDVPQAFVHRMGSSSNVRVLFDKQTILLFYVYRFYVSFILVLLYIYIETINFETCMYFKCNFSEILLIKNSVAYFQGLRAYRTSCLVALLYHLFRD